MEKATLRVGGMTCGNCVKHVTKALQKAGIAEPRVDLASGRVELSYDPATVTLQTLTEAVARAGYTATVME